MNASKFLTIALAVAFSLATISGCTKSPGDKGDKAGGKSVKPVAAPRNNTESK